MPAKLGAIDQPERCSKEVGETFVLFAVTEHVDTHVLGVTLESATSMKYPIELSSLLSSGEGETSRRLESFALLTLGVIESLTNGSLKPEGAMRCYFHGRNCRYIRKLRNKAADEIMGRGVQLGDLFDVLPPDEARREFERELGVMRGLCVRLLRKRKLVA